VGFLYSFSCTCRIGRTHIRTRLFFQGVSCLTVCGGLAGSFLGSEFYDTGLVGWLFVHGIYRECSECVGGMTGSDLSDEMADVGYNAIYAVVLTMLRLPGLCPVSVIFTHSDELLSTVQTAWGPVWACRWTSRCLGSKKSVKFTMTKLNAEASVRGARKFPRSSTNWR
jgi:hypothetical protein